MTLLRHAVRRLARRPVESLVTILTLALGIGATTAMFSVVDATLLRPAPFPHADRLVDVLQVNLRTGGGGSGLSPRLITGWREQPALFEAFEGYSLLPVDLTGGERPERLTGMVVSTGLFDMLGMRPALGRGFVEGDGRLDDEPVALIDEDFWRSRFGADPGVLGRVLTLSERQYTVVGVVPSEFSLLRKPEVWLPLDLEHAPAGERALERFFGIARLRPGLSLAQAQAQIDAAAPSLQEVEPLRTTWGLRLLEKRAARVSVQTRASLWALLGAVGCLLLVALSNVCNLFLALVAARRREFAVQASLGASRLRLCAAVVAEALVTSAPAALLGVLLARWGIDGLYAVMPPEFGFMTTVGIALDWRILGFSIALTVLAAIGTAVLPALRGSRVRIDDALRGSSAGDAHATGRLAGGFVIVQVALSVVLLAGAAVLAHTVLRMETADLGFVPEQVAVTMVYLPTDRYPDDATRTLFFDNVRDRLLEMPGIIASGSALMGSPDTGTLFARFVTDERPLSDEGAESVPWNQVSGEYFSVLRIPLLEGRVFGARPAAGEVIISKSLAAHLFPEGSAVGRRYRESPDDQAWNTVVGVVGDVAGEDWDEAPTRRLIYKPYVPQQTPTNPTSARLPMPDRRYYVRAVVVRGDSLGAAMEALRPAVWDVDSALPVPEVLPLAQVYAERWARERFVRTAMAAFAGLALILSSVGILAVLSRLVAARRREIAIRTAIGAAPGDVLRLVMGRGLALAAMGVVLGLAAGLAASRVLTSLIAEADARDPVGLSAAVLVLLAAATLACWLPARRALAIDPAAALRE